MSKIEIKQAVTKREIKNFILFPWNVYKNDPNWVPPLIIEKKMMLDKKKNPFFEHGEMDIFMAYSDGKAVGRIAAIINYTHNQIHNEKAGFFGFFECLDNQDAANALFDTAVQWIKDKGMTKVIGPASPTSNDEYGFLIEGAEGSPVLMMPYNPKYYIRLLENYGFKKAKDLYAYIMESDKIFYDEKILRGSELVRKRNNVTIRTLDMKNFKNELDIVKQIYNKAWAVNWGFVPMTDAEIDFLAEGLKPLVNPELVLFMEKEGQPIGFALVMPDYNQIFKKMNGRLLPFGIFHILFGKKKIDLARTIILGLIPEHQKKGLDALFYLEITARARKFNIFKGEASWILEDNLMMNRGAEMMKADLYRKYRVFEMDVPN